MRNALTGHRRVNLPLRFRRDEDLGLVATIRAKSGPMAFRRDLIGQPPGGFAGLVRDTTVITIPSATIMPLGVGADAAQTIEAWRGAPPCGRRTGWACMIAIDWGTTQLRAYRLDDTGAIVSRRSQPKGSWRSPEAISHQPSMRSPATGMVRLIVKSS